ncbi:MAG: translation initiation factor IF-3 [Candidatus Paceibacterota bacterium]
MHNKREKSLRINQSIRAEEVRVINQNGENLGVMSLRNAQIVAESEGYDLVEISPDAVPPVCKIADFSKLMYQQSVKEKQERKKSTRIVVKELKLRPRIAEHDLDTKINHAREWLLTGYKVVFSVGLKGRESTHPDQAINLLKQVQSKLSDVSSVESPARFLGRDALMILVPLLKK